ncbi:hypothetical protein JTE90_012333 [Oedothorax gibbosus]|uniref:Uncharacterized protein n=1 Tax=Oedothorax gibbosus TaxID=931172 RepID=A0AAV6VIT1_9ARAC|nr:hypothetical protein JTE90_012333 [Oedothorax gibbosus]
MNQRESSNPSPNSPETTEVLFFIFLITFSLSPPPPCFLEGRGRDPPPKTEAYSAALLLFQDIQKHI